MKRREFIVGLGGITAAGPFAARAQDERTRIVGVQLGTSQQDEEQRRLVLALTHELARLGWVEGRNVRFEYRWGGGDLARVQQQAAELVASAPDVIFAQGTPVVTPLKSTTRAIPVIFVNVADPVGGGIVASLSKLPTIGFLGASTHRTGPTGQPRL